MRMRKKSTSAAIGPTDSMIDEQGEEPTSVYVNTMAKTAHDLDVACSALTDRREYLYSDET